MLEKARQNVFPLLLAPIDQYYVADDSDAYPMTSVIQLDFQGAIVRSAWEAAVHEALMRHQLLRAVIRPAKRNLPCWVTSPEVQPQLDWGTLDAPIRFERDERIDLSRECGLRMWNRVGDERSNVTVQVHHASTDGTGAYRFLGDVLACYAAYQSGDPNSAELHDIDTTWLRKRRSRMIGPAYDGGRFHACREALRLTLDVWGRQVDPLRVPKTDPAPRVVTDYPGICSHVLPGNSLQLLRTAATNRGVMLNDLLVAQLFVTIRRWNQNLHSGRNESLRVMMPVDLREKQDYDMPAGNLTSYALIDHRGRECDDPEEILAKVQRDTARIKNERLGLRFSDLITMACDYPRLLPFMMSRHKCLASAVLSNIGDPTRRFTARIQRRRGKVYCGNLVLDRFTGVPPLRRNTRATIAVFTYAKELTVSLRCDPHLFSRSATQDFLDLYVDGLSNFARSGETAAPSEGDSAASERISA